MSSDALNLLALALLLGLGAWGLAHSSTLEPFSRRLVCVTVLGTNAAYLAWRLLFTLPENLTPATLPAWIYLAIELLALAEASLFWLCLSRTSEPRPAPPPWPVDEPLPTVEVWIPTYREPVEVLEKSVLAALALDHPGLKVRVLDDGRRDWLRAQCERWGVDHVTRTEHRHAKAGNLNHALASSEADFAVIMDADFAAHHDFVRRVLPHFAEERLAILQTPQAFYNPDLAQQNLGLGGRIADEQALFFRDIQPARDAWGAAFFCGSCAMVRLAALREIGGFPTDSITEDLLTSLRLQHHGWHTRYLNERLSMGLAAESISAFFVQRDRWSRGAIEILFLPDGPLRNRHLGLMQRLLFLPLYWLISPFFHLAVMLLPIVCLLTGLDVMVIDNPADMYLVVIPTVLINLMTLTWISHGRFMPFVSTALSMLMALRLSYSALGGLLRPGGTAFKVTPKGTQAQAGSDRLLFNLMMGLTLLTLAAMVYAGWASHTPSNQQVALPWLIFLGAFNLLHFLVALVMVEDRPRLRGEERFRIGRALPLVLDDGRTASAHVVDMSASGLRLRGLGERAPHASGLSLADQVLPLQLLGQRPGPDGQAHDPVYRFGTLTQAQRTVLIQFLFSGRHDPVVQGEPGVGRALRLTARSVIQGP